VPRAPPPGRSGASPRRRAGRTSQDSPARAPAAERAASSAAARVSDAVERPLPIRTGIQRTIVPGAPQARRSRRGATRKRRHRRKTDALVPSVDGRPGPPAMMSRMPPPTLVAIFGPTGVGKTAVAVALADVLRRHGEDPAAVSADALQLYAGLPVLTGAAGADERARLEHRLLGILPVTATATAGAFAPPGACGDRRAPGEGATADRRRRPGPVPAGGARGARAPAAAGSRGQERASRPPRRRGRTCAARGARPHATRTRQEPSPRPTPSACRALELLDVGERPPAGEQLWTATTRRPTLLAGLTWSATRSTPASRPGSTR
jgi:hypothetical protein